MFKLNDKVTAAYDKRELMKLGKEIDKNGSLQVNMAITQLDKKGKTNSDQQKKSVMITHEQKKVMNENG